jgi:hypothetical protein
LGRSNGCDAAISKAKKPKTLMRSAAPALPFDGCDDRRFHGDD